MSEVKLKKAAQFSEKCLDKLIEAAITDTCNEPEEDILIKRFNPNALSTGSTGIAVLRRKLER